MTPEKCPCCEREFKKLSDFPKIYIANFETVQLPEDTKLPFGSFSLIFEDPDRARLDSNLQFNSPALPIPVRELFRNPEVEAGSHQLQPSVEFVRFRGWKYQKELEVIAHDIPYYRIRLYKDDIKDTVLYSVRRLKQTIEPLIGQEVSPDIVRPKSLPRAVHYGLEWVERGGLDRLNKADLHVTSLDAILGIAGVTYKSNGIVATLEYEGRLNQ